MESYFDPKPIPQARAMLVYQAGIANVFSVRHFSESPDGRNAKRLLQADFRTCIAFARGMVAAGADVMTAWCNQAGEIASSHWHCNNFDDAPFSESFVIVESPVAVPA